ncbi:MAG: class I SAM-dependent methyltransferase [Pseudomonadota bacterium]
MSHDAEYIRRIEQDHEAWKRKPVLRAIYQDLYRRMQAACRPGISLEIGGGGGNLKEWLPSVVATDIQWAPWLDAVADAQNMPFVDASFDNIILFDVLHHIPGPHRFFAEAQRVLRPGGRVVMMEPGVTPVSWVMMNTMHHEPAIMAADPFRDQEWAAQNNPYAANQAIPSLMFQRHRRRFEAEFPDLRIVSVERLSLFAYPLSGGFRPWCLLPQSVVGGMLKLEDVLMPVLGPLMAFRLMVVVERRQTGA